MLDLNVGFECFKRKEMHSTHSFELKDTHTHTLIDTVIITVEWHRDIVKPGKTVLEISKKHRSQYQT